MMLPKFLPLLLILALAGCAASPRKERAQVRELSLHAHDEGTRFVEAGNMSVAADRFERAITISPRPASYLELGKTKEAMGIPEAAALAYWEAMKLAPDYQEARFALLALGYHPPTHEELASTPGLIETYSKQITEEAEIRYIERERRAGELTPEQREELRETIRAREARAASERTPTVAEVRAALFPASGPNGELPSATDPTYANDRSVILNTYPYHYANGQRFQRKNEFEKAAAEYQLALNASPNEIEARLSLGDCMLKLEEFPQAIFHYQTAAEQFPDSPRPLLKLGNYFDTLKDAPRAHEFYQKAIDKDPTYTEAYNNLAALEIREQKYDQAIVHLTQAIQIDPEYALAHLNLGVAQENAGDKKAALESYRKYVSLGGDQSPEVRKWIAEME